MSQRPQHESITILSHVAQAIASATDAQSLSDALFRVVDELIAVQLERDAQGRFLKGLILTEMNRPSEAIGMVMIPSALWMSADLCNQSN